MFFISPNANHDVIFHSLVTDSHRPLPKIVRYKKQQLLLLLLSVNMQIHVNVLQFKRRLLSKCKQEEVAEYANSYSLFFKQFVILIVGPCFYNLYNDINSLHRGYYKI